ncbi:MAG: TetR/AcrR family transcriptional regulator [Acidimicrobiia bacterium]|nr:TetR/AcrR family transcriptional regulator [Acidimicrobiia bacterium]MDH4309506.1 TetR/AcrR family transcriptional regulator [Acidimicrobiia bacterium]
MSSADSRLIAAAVEELMEHGYRGATTKSIAERAGVNEVTLFRRFGTKRDLMTQALDTVTTPFRQSMVEPTYDLVTDLVSIAGAYASMVDREPRLVSRVIPELTTEPELRDVVTSLQQPVIDALRALFTSHQEAGRLVDGHVDDLMRAFLGPLAARAFMAYILEPKPFDASAHVQRFLEGHRPRT